MHTIKMVFMGTPDFAVPCLNRMVEDGYNVTAAVTQPDRPSGRGNKLKASPVKQAAVEHGIAVLQPVTVKDAAVIAEIGALRPDIIVVVAFGQILPPEILALPRLGCINVHASLLPRYRGAAPIHRAILDGEKVTGVTTMHMARGLDTGDMILRKSLDIGANMTVGELHDSLSAMGAELLSETVRLLASDAAPREPQDNSLATYAAMLSRADEEIDWTASAQAVHDKIRGLNPWPVAFSTYDGRNVKIWRSEIMDTDTVKVPGKIEAIIGDMIIVQCGKGKVALHEVQPAGKRRMSGGEFARGYRGEKGKVKTQYQNLIDKEDIFADGFFVPENVYILATMNDIDRSIESMDFAMRRRFAWKEIKPEDRMDMLSEKLNPNICEKAIKVMTALNKAITNTRGLGKAYQIGPAYFLKLSEENYNGDFSELWDLHIEVLLRDYLRSYSYADAKVEEFKNVYFDSLNNKTVDVID